MSTSVMAVAPRRLEQWAIIAGFCLCLGLLGAALFDAARLVWNGASAKVADRERVEAEEKVLGHIRQLLNQSQPLARDFFLDPRSDRAAIFTRKLEKARAEMQDAVQQLSGSRELRDRVQAYWDFLGQIAEWRPATVRERAFVFVREELPAARRPVGELLRARSEENDRALRKFADDTAAVERARVRRVLSMLGGGLAMGLLVFALCLGAMRRLRRRIARELLDASGARRELEQLSARLLEVQEEERRALSRELHDSIGQTLTAIRMEIRHMMDGAGLDEVDRHDRLRELIDEAMRSVRGTAIRLRPSLLDDLGLEPALRWHVDEFERRTNIRCRYSAVGLQQMLPDEWNTCIYRIVQEAVHNSEKHAAPTLVQVRIRQDSEWLTLEIEDNGTGFKMAVNGSPTRALGLGLLGMRERAAMLGGTIMIDSAPGRGTCISVRLPAAHAQPAAGAGAAVPERTSVEAAK